MDAEYDILGNPYALYDQYSQHTYVSVNHSKKEMTIYFSDGQKTYSVGELLIELLYISDHEMMLYEQDRKELIIDFSSYDRSIVEGKHHYFDEVVENYLKHINMPVDDYAKKTAIYDCLNRNKLMHPYMKVMDLFTSILPEDNDRLLHELLNINMLRNKILKIFSFCFDTDTEYLNELDSIKRYYFYIASGRGDFPLDFKSKVIPLPQQISPEHYTIFWKTFSKDFQASDLWKFQSIKELQQPQDITEKTIEVLHSMNIEFQEVYEVNNFVEIAFLELYQMLLLNDSVKKCALCDRYFILKGKYGSKYCDRLVEGKNKTCQQLGSTQDFQKRVKNSPAHREYMKAYKRLYSRIKYGMITREQFDQWKDDARFKKQLCETGLMDIQDLIDWLGN